MRAADEEEGDRQDDYQTRHNPQFGEQSLKLVYACSLLDLSGEEARMLREEPDEWYAGFVAELTEVDRRVLERSEVRAITIGMFQEAVRQGAVGWVDDVVRLGRPWPFRLDEVVADVRFHHGEDDTNVPPQHAKELAERIPGSRLLMYPGEGHISVFDNPIKGIVEILLAA